MTGSRSHSTSFSYNRTRLTEQDMTDRTVPHGRIRPSPGRVASRLHSSHRGKQGRQRALELVLLQAVRGGQVLEVTMAAPVEVAAAALVEMTVARPGLEVAAAAPTKTTLPIRGAVAV